MYHCYRNAKTQFVFCILFPYLGISVFSTSAVTLFSFSSPYGSPIQQLFNSFHYPSSTCPQSLQLFCLLNTELVSLSSFHLLLFSLYSQQLLFCSFKFSCRLFFSFFFSLHFFSPVCMPPLYLFSHMYTFIPLKPNLNRRVHGCRGMQNVRVCSSLRSPDQGAFQVKGNNNKESDKQITQRHKPDKQTNKETITNTQILQALSDASVRTYRYSFEQSQSVFCK